jgi:transmembrane sensor
VSPATKKSPVDKKDWQRLARYYAGEGSSEDEREIQRWLASDPERARVVTSMREVWDLSGTFPPSHGGDSRRVWNWVRARVLQRPEETSPRQIPVARGRWFAPPSYGSRWGRSVSLLPVAALVLIALVPLLWRPASDLLQRHSAPGAMREFVTDKGQRLRLTLGDGSVIEVGADSKLRIPIPFAGNRRDVRLEGTALFDVAHDSERPFRVHARNAVTRVLGTRFVVRAYSRENAVRVAVVEGRVALQPESAGERTGTVLTRGQLGRLAPDGRVSLIRDEGEFNYLLGWTTGRLEFTNEPLSAVLSELELWYGVEFRVPDPDLASQPLSTVIEGDRLEHILDVISLVLDARYERSGNRITLYSSWQVTDSDRGPRLPHYPNSR